MADGMARRVEEVETAVVEEVECFALSDGEVWVGEGEFAQLAAFVGGLHDGGGGVGWVAGCEGLGEAGADD